MTFVTRKMSVGETSVAFISLKVLNGDMNIEVDGNNLMWCMKLQDDQSLKLL